MVTKLWICEVCGHQNKDESEFCEQCGEPKGSPSYIDMPNDLVEDEDLGLF